MQGSVIRHTHSAIWNVRTHKGGRQRSVWHEETRRDWRSPKNSKRKTLRDHRRGVIKAVE